MESRMDEVCAEMKNTASNIAQILAFVKRTVENHDPLIPNPNPDVRNVADLPYSSKTTSKTPVDGKLFSPAKYWLLW